MNQLYDGGVRSYMNYCSYLMSNPPPHVKDTVDAAMLSGKFQPGVSFMEQNLDPAVAEASAAAVERLRKVGLSVGEYAYRSTPTRLVRRSIAANPAVGQLLQQQKKSLVGLISFKDKRLETADLPPVHLCVLHPQGVDWLIRYVRYLKGYCFGRDGDPDLHAKWASKVGRQYIHCSASFTADTTIVVSDEDVECDQSVIMSIVTGKQYPLR